MKRDEIFLRHILKAAKRINNCLNKSKKGLLDDDDATDILVRQLSIVGEAGNNLSTDFKKKYKKEIPFRDIVSMRNFIVHEYFNVDKKRVWDTSINKYSRAQKENQSDSRNVPLNIFPHHPNLPAIFN